MRCTWMIAAIGAAAVLAPRAAEADPVKVQVTEMAGGIAFVTPGRNAGLVPGTKVRFGKNALTVLDATDDSAAVTLDGLAVKIGQVGIADVEAGAAAGTKGPAKPLRAEAFKAQWPDPVRPADQQQPRSVPLGSGRPPGAVRLTVVGNGYAAVSRDHSNANGEARLIASWNMLADRPLAADVDVAGRLFSEGYDKHLRVPVFVRALQVRYGDAIDPRLALGRLRFAASSVGMLDGGRGAVRVGDVEVAAFGGIVPDPVSGKPDTSASRFGVETSYDLSTSAWRPRVSVTASGSTWSGKLDERRLSVAANANRGPLNLDGWVEAQQFAADNPWGARAFELTGASATAEWRSHGNHVGVDVDFLRPERSLRLAAALPPGWLCSQEPQPGDVMNESCQTGDYWTTATASAGLRRGRFALDAYGSVGRTHLISTTLDTSAYVRGEVRLGEERVSVGGSAGKAGFASWTSGELGVGTAAIPRVDLQVRYRAELLDYVASTGPVLMNTIAADLRYLHSAPLDLALSAIGTAGPDRDVLALLTTVVWRPLP